MKSKLDTVDVVIYAEYLSSLGGIETAVYNLLDALNKKGVNAMLVVRNFQLATDIFKYAQAGHYIDGRNNFLLFNEDFTNSQCMFCNINRSGDKDNYRNFLIRKLGLHKVQEFEDNHSRETMIESYQFQEIKNYYRQKIKELLSKK